MTEHTPSRESDLDDLPGEYSFGEAGEGPLTLKEKAEVVDEGLSTAKDLLEEGEHEEAYNQFNALEPYLDAVISAKETAESKLEVFEGNFNSLYRSITGDLEDIAAGIDEANTYAEEIIGKAEDYQNLLEDNTTLSSNAQRIGDELSEWEEYENNR